MKICLFGGSFDPVHCGHLAIARAASEQVGLDEIVFLPAAESPFKIGHSFLFSSQERLELLRLATADCPWARVSDADLRLPPPSWSWRLVELWHRQHPEAELYWLMGTDQWDALHRWARCDYLCEQLRFIVYHRGTPPCPRPGVRATFIEGNHPASSTALRALLTAGAPLPPDSMPPAAEQRAREMLRARRA